MIFTSESGLTDPNRVADWDQWYLGHLAAMVSVPGVASAQRFGTQSPGVPPSLAMYTVASAAVFDSDIYRQTRGMGPFVPVVDERLHRRNLFDGLGAAPEVAMSAVLLVADRDAPVASETGIIWLRAVGLDRSTAYRGIGVFPDQAAAQAAAARLGGAVALYTPLTERFRGTEGSLAERHFNALGQPVGAPLPGWTARPTPPRSAMEGRYCTVRPLDPERDSAQLFAAFAEDREGRMWSYLPREPYASVAQLRAWADAAGKTDDPLVHTIVDHATGEAVGAANYMRIDPASGVIEIGSITYSPRLQRRPAGTEAMYLMMRRVFDELGYRRYEWKCNSLNAPSRAAATRYGFQYEGLFRQAQVVKGRNRDTAWFSILDSEWPVLRAAFERWLDPGNFDAGGTQCRSLASFRSDL